VRLWARSAPFVAHFNAHHRHPHCLQDHAFARGITAVGPALPTREELAATDVVLFAIPTEGVRSVRTGDASAER
jgi:glycerol-3-phosphate dehydrogenase